MIHSISGTVVEKLEHTVLIKVGNFVLQILCDSETLKRIEPGQPVQLYTYLQLNQDELVLYGFLTLERLRIFRKILKVSKIGPRTALRIVSTVEPEELVWLIKKGEVAKLASLPGIGRKTAERLIAELKDEDFQIEADFSSEVFDAIEALSALGFSRQESKQVVLSVYKKGMDVEEVIKESLKLLSRKS